MLAPFQPAIDVLVSIPGIQRRTAEVVIAEIGTDMSRFPTSRHLASWAGLCPGNNESAGKRKHGRITKGSPWLRTALVEAALGATRPTGYLRSKYWRVRSRRGHQRAVIAVAHAMLEIIHQLLSTGELYTDLGADFFDKRQPNNSPAARSASSSASATRSSSRSPQQPKPRSRTDLFSEQQGFCGLCAQPVPGVRRSP